VLIFEQKEATLLVKLDSSRKTVCAQTERLSVPVIQYYLARGSTQNLSETINCILLFLLCNISTHATYCSIFLTTYLTRNKGSMHKKKNIDIPPVAV
jgi:hypothetical protein